MSNIHIQWKTGIDWSSEAHRVIAYYAERPELKYGPKGDNKAFGMIDTLCTWQCVTRDRLKQSFGFFSDDAPSTILSNVTMALQKSGTVWAPEDGGWYFTLTPPLMYVVSPHFAAAWLALER